MDNPVRLERKKLNTGLVSSSFLFVGMIVLFVLLNIMKITLFNMFLLYSFSFRILAYKLLVTTLLTVLVSLILLSCKRPALMVLLYILQVLYIAAYLVYFQNLHGYIQLAEITTLYSEGLKAFKFTGIPRSPELLVSVMDLPFFIYIVSNYSRVREINARYKPLKNVMIAMCLLLIVLNEARNYHYGNFVDKYIRDVHVGESYMVQRYGTLALGSVDLFHKQDTEELVEKLQYGPVLTVENNSADRIPSPEKPNFIFIQVESMDANIIEHQYKGEYVTPYLNSLSKESIYYPYMLSYHEGGGTSDCEFSVIDSVEPLDNYPALKISDYNYPNSFMQIFNKNGYKTIGYHGNDGSFYNRNRAFANMDFGQFKDIYGMQLKRVGMGAPDKDVFNHVKEDLMEQKSPFLDYVITISSHNPYTSVKEAGYVNDRYEDIEENTAREYFNSMSYVDEAIEDLVSYVRENIPNTYIIIYGDHTPPAVSGDTFKTATLEKYDRYFEFVPLFIITPDHKTYREKERVASFIDISPTVLHASGLPFTVQTNGMDLIGRENVQKEIAYRQGVFDRSLLYEDMQDQKQP